MEKLLMPTPLHAPGKSFNLCVLIFVISTFTNSVHVSTASAGDLVSGRYLSASGKSIVLSLSIGKPSPANLIVEQYISPGSFIEATSPKAIKIDNKRGKVKWLFRNTRSGKLRLTITLKNATRGPVEAMARYRDPRSGQFTELQIDP